MSKKEKAQPKLSAAGQEAEELLAGILKDMKKDLKEEPEARRYHLLDQLRVVDRIAKFEAIKAKIDSDEGSIFDEPIEDDSPQRGDDDD